MAGNLSIVPYATKLATGGLDPNPVRKRCTHAPGVNFGLRAFSTAFLRSSIPGRSWELCGLTLIFGNFLARLARSPQQKPASTAPSR